MNERTGTPGSRRFFWWFFVLQLVPLVGLIAVSKAFSVWTLITLANTCVFFFNLSRYFGNKSHPDAKANRRMLFAGCVMFGLMTVVWAVLLALCVWRTGSLGSL